MELNLFDFSGEKNYLTAIREELKPGKVIPNARTLNSILKHTSISFTIEQCSRLLSQKIVEGFDSYTQQSQRYVKIKKISDAFIIPKKIEESNLKKTYLQLNTALFDFYSTITDEKLQGTRAIPPEDARYILPLSTQTNIMVSMSGDKLYEFLKLFEHDKSCESQELKENLMREILKTKLNLNSSLNTLLLDLEDELDLDCVKRIKQKTFDKINSDVEFLGGTSHPIIRVGLGAATSTNSKTPSKLHELRLKKGGEEFLIQKCADLTKRVTGYGHLSIVEHDRPTIGHQFSLTAYHQFIRHRLPKHSREAFSDIPLDRDYELPPLISQNQEFKDEFESLVKFSKELRGKIKKEIGEDESNYMLLNCEKIKSIVSYNARVLNEYLTARLCLNAQWDIRQKAEVLLDKLRDYAPELYDTGRLGPACVRGKCTEGKKYCGKIVEVRAMYKGVQKHLPTINENKKET